MPCLITSARPERNSRSGRVRERRRIHDDEPGLMERADQVLGAGMVDRGLAADRRVHLGQQRGRHLDEVHPAHVGRGDEAREVAHRAAAQRHDGRASGRSPRPEGGPTARARRRASWPARPPGQDERHQVEARAPQRLRVTGSPCRRAIAASVTRTALRPTRSLASSAPTAARAPAPTRMRYERGPRLTGISIMARGLRCGPDYQPFR